MERIQVVVHQLAQLGQVVVFQVEESLPHLHVLTLDCCGERALCVYYWSRVISCLLIGQSRVATIGKNA